MHVAARDRPLWFLGEKMKVALLSETLRGTNLEEKDMFPGG